MSSLFCKNRNLAALRWKRGSLGLFLSPFSLSLKTPLPLHPGLQNEWEIMYWECWKALKVKCQNKNKYFVLLQLNFITISSNSSKNNDPYILCNLQSTFMLTSNSTNININTNNNQHLLTASCETDTIHTVWCIYVSVCGNGRSTTSVYGRTQ